MINDKLIAKRHRCLIIKHSNLIMEHLFLVFIIHVLFSRFFAPILVPLLSICLDITSSFLSFTRNLQQFTILIAKDIVLSTKILFAVIPLTQFPLLTFIYYVYHLSFIISIVRTRVVRGFGSDGDVVRVAFVDTGVGDAGEFGLVKLIDGGGTTVTHAGA